MVNAVWVIRRPKRKTVTEEEALYWTESFAAERKEPFIAAIRKIRLEPCAEAHGYAAQTPQNTASRGWEQNKE